VLGLTPPPSPRLWAGPAHRATARRLVPPGGPVLAVGPAANWRGKQWRAERFAELVERLTGPGGILPGARVAVLAAVGEREQARPLLPWTWRRRARVCGAAPCSSATTRG
jgi:lipopolysaccharide export system permease protein